MVSNSLNSQPAVILHSPQMGENIGAVARSMKNFGLHDLRLVTPRDGWPNPKALETARNATDVIEAATVFASLSDALADVHTIYATTARPRGMVKPVFNARQTAKQLSSDIIEGKRPALLFGPERTGLDNDSIALSTAICSIPVSPDYTSLNISQAVTVMCYEWFQLQENIIEEAPELKDLLGDQAFASGKELTGLFSHLEKALDNTHFFQEPDKKPKMMRNLQNIFNRAHLTEQEVRTLRGIIRSLAQK